MKCMQNLVTIFHTWNGKQSTSLGTAEETDQVVKAKGCSWFESSVLEELKVDEDTDCEVVWAKVKIRSSSDLYIGSFKDHRTRQIWTICNTCIPVYSASQQTKELTFGSAVISTYQVLTGKRICLSPVTANSERCFPRTGLKLLEPQSHHLVS